MSDPVTPPPPNAPWPPPRPPQSRWGALSVTLLAIGLLILVPSGLCTGILGIGAIYSMLAGSGSDAGDMLSTVVLVGGIPIAIGGLLVAVAFAARRK